mmetsp:Transcript_26831/g.44193  ORF Transcript_26831/g.44193 Transcript_26831/m.44193 type:complete len:183 (-) Transcript_26831:47-595(-)
MGRRAKKAPVQTKKRPTLAKRFKCPFCANDETVECKMDFKVGIGSLACRLCGASYQMPIHHLHEPVDVFSEWLDDCEAAQQGKPTGGSGAAGAGGVPLLGDSSGAPQYESSDDDDGDDDDNDLGQPSGLSRPLEAATTTKNDQNKGNASSSSAAAGAAGGGGSAPSYSALGLDDSDDDDDSE